VYIDQRHAAILGVVAYDGRVQPVVREAMSTDDAVMDVIAREGDASADADYLVLVRSQGGRVLVAEQDGRVVAFGGVVDVDGVSMLTDLFVSEMARGAGIGTQLLRELFDGSSRRMTFSSKHPAALAAYQRVGMEPQWRLLYLEGVANGGGTGLPAAEWQHERRSLVERMASQGAHVSADVVSIPEDPAIWIARVQTARPVKAVSATLAGLPRGSVVKLCVPEYSPLATWALKSGFAETDYDTFCATPGIALPPDLHCLDPGLA
jgi:GNAT superfamily N-acetyltransferase